MPGIIPAVHEPDTLFDDVPGCEFYDAEAAISRSQE